MKIVEVTLLTNSEKILVNLDQVLTIRRKGANCTMVMTDNNSYVLLSSYENAARIAEQTDAFSGD